MQHHRNSIEFEGMIDEHGAIVVPDAALDHFPKGSGNKVHVRLTGPRISSALKEKRVNEDEIERIASLQLESRDQVVTFLLSEGSLRNRKSMLRQVKKRAKGTTH